MPAEVLKDLTIHKVETMEEVISIAFPEGAKLKRKSKAKPKGKTKGAKK